MAAFDSRTIGDSDVLAWHEVMGDAPFEEAAQVVKGHYVSSRERIMPADVLWGIGMLHKSRLEKADATFVPDCDPDDTREYIRQLREHRRAVVSSDVTELLELPGVSVTWMG